MIYRMLGNLHFACKRWVPNSLCLFSLVFFLASATALASPAETDKNPNPCNLNEEEVQGLSHDASTEASALDDYIATVSRMAHQERFDQLDCMGDRARGNKERFSGGQWKIHNLYQGLYEPAPGKHATEEDWQDLMHLLQRWVQSHPKSVTARVALAWAWIGYAGEARGNGYAGTVSEKGWKLYAERTAEAEKALEDAAAVPACPESYAVKFNIAENQSWGKERILALFDEASAFEPGYSFYYGRAVAMLLEPKWFGEPGDTAKFLQDSADRIGGKDGDAYYFLVASSKDVICGCGDQQPKLSLDRVERGYDAVEQMYGVSMLNLNQLAYLALSVNPHRRDVILADKTFQRIGQEWSNYSWDDEQSFEKFKNWTRQMVPATKEFLAQEGDAQGNLKTPEGAQYQPGVEKAYKEMVRECARSNGEGVDQWVGEFETLIRVGSNGSVEDGRLNDMGPVVLCLYKKMRSSHDDKSPLFPVPPKGSYWVRIDLEWGDFAPVAAER